MWDNLKRTKLYELTRFPEKRLYKTDLDTGNQMYYPADLDDANVIGSHLTDSVGTKPRGDKDSLHTVMLDIDLPVHVVPSSTPGHFHLYIDKVILWKDYLELLEVLVKVGIVEEGYVKASEDRGMTTLRLPWINKGETDASAGNY